MDNYVGKICPFCKISIKENDAVKVCPECGVPHHKICWDANKGCTTKDCTFQNYEEQPPEPSRFCKKCGAALAEGQAFCSKCGERTDYKSEKPEGSIKPKKSMLPLVLGIIAGVAVIAVVLVLFVGPLGKKDFNRMYGDLAGYSWCTIAADGSYMKIDNNPDDTAIKDYTYTEYQLSLAADEAIEKINKELGFSDALWEKMNTTTALYGMRTETNEKYTVSWAYHPDKGLEVMYEFKK